MEIGIWLTFSAIAIVAGVAFVVWTGRKKMHDAGATESATHEISVSPIRPPETGLQNARVSKIDEVLGLDGVCIRFANSAGREVIVCNVVSWRGAIWGLLWAPLWTLSRGYWSQTLVTMLIGLAWVPTAVLLTSDVTVLVLFGSPFLNALYCMAGASSWEKRRLEQKGFRVVERSAPVTAYGSTIY